MKDTVLVGALLWLLGAGPLLAEDFWSVQEIADIDGFSELDGVVKLKFKDAVTAKPIPGLRLQFDDQTGFSGNDDGVLELPSSTVEGLVDQDLPFTVTAPGYVDYRDSLHVRVGTLVTKRFVLSPVLEARQARLVVEWGRTPADLDAWLVGPDFTVSYRSMNNAAGNARLDRDARNGWGPETITLLNIRPDADYLFSVVNYSNEAPMDGVKVSLYVNNSLIRVFSFPKTSQRKVDLVKIHHTSVEILVP